MLTRSLQDIPAIFLLEPERNFGGGRQNKTPCVRETMCIVQYLLSCHKEDEPPCGFQTMPFNPKQGTRQYLRVYQRGVPSVLVRVGAVKNWTYCNTSETALRHKSLICVDEYVFLHKFYDKTASIALKSTNGVKIFKTADETAVPGSNPSFCTVKTQN